VLLASAVAATRPQYGGALRVTTWATSPSLDPGTEGGANTWSRNLAALLYDTLVTLDENGQPQPGLAISWQPEPGNQRWQFRLRPGVRFQDGSQLTAEVAAASLRAANSRWKVFASADAVVLELAAPDPNFLATLAQSRYAVVKHGANGNLVGTGPFRIASWDPGKRLVVNANDDYWNGRPYLDSIQLDLGVPSRDQLIALELGKTDVAEQAPEQTHHAASEGFRTIQSSPAEFVGLLFSRDPQGPEEATLREALSLSIDRAALSNVFLQGLGEPAGSLLPNWISGYAFLFPPVFDRVAAREKRATLSSTPHWTLSYDASDPMARVLAERVALNAQDVGLSLHAGSASNADLRLVSVSFSSVAPPVALDGLLNGLSIPRSQRSLQTEQDVYEAEAATLQARRLIPLLFLSETYTLSSDVQGWSQSRLGTWRPANLWLARKGK
jgi:ABC-type transport system substrate-binding protein